MSGPCVRTTGFCLLLTTLALAQEAERERCVVTFAKRSFDLEPLRRAILESRSAAEVRLITESLDADTRAEQAPFVAFVEQLGGRVTRQWWIVNGCAVEIPRRQRAQLSARENVLRVDDDRALRPNVAPILESTNAKNHSASTVHAQGVLGQGIAIAILDTGLDSDHGGTGLPHPAFFIGGDPRNQTGPGLGGSRLLANVQIGSYPADDQFGHGTAVAACAAGEKWNAGPHAGRGHAPGANLIGYAIADKVDGSANVATIISAWQQVVQDRVAGHIVAANLCNDGSWSPLAPEQQAMDTAAYVGDILITVAAGNGGASSILGHGATNVLAVGATRRDTRQVADFSSRGPLFGDTQRFYPDIVANGVDMTLPVPDNAAVDVANSGTSFAAPQVCGAAALYRSLRPTANALETRAAILATTEDIATKNLTPPYDSRNAYGLGYLRDDRLVQVAQGAGFIRSGFVTTGATSVSHPFPVTQGILYAAVTTWPRLASSSSTWSEIELIAAVGTTTLAISNAPRNTCQKVVFRAPFTGTVTLTIKAHSLENWYVPYVLVACESVDPSQLGRMTSFGSGCAGTGSPSEGTIVVPSHLAGAFGGAGNDFVVGTPDTRCQQLIDQSLLPNAFAANVLRFRLDNSQSQPTPAHFIDLDVSLGSTALTAQTLSTDFDQNITGASTRVVRSRRVALPTFTPAGTPADYGLTLPFDQPWQYIAQPGISLVIDTVRVGGTLGAYSPYALDAWVDPTFVLTASVVGSAKNEGLGVIYPGFGTVLSFANLGSQPLAPALACQEVPRIGMSHTLLITDALPFTPAVLTFGLSNTSWLGRPLPLDLTPIGAPGCNLLTSVDVNAVFATDAFGAARLALPVPLQPVLVGNTAFHQSVIVDLRANKRGIALTNGLAGTFGR